MAEKTGSPEHDSERHENERVHFELSHEQIGALLVAIHRDLEDTEKELTRMKQITTLSSQEAEDYNILADAAGRLRELQKILSEKFDPMKLNREDD